MEFFRVVSVFRCKRIPLLPRFTDRQRQFTFFRDQTGWSEILIKTELVQAVRLNRLLPASFLFFKSPAFPSFLVLEDLTGKKKILFCWGGAGRGVPVDIGLFIFYWLQKRGGNNNV
jgi:hypothetical protein